MQTPGSSNSEEVTGRPSAVVSSEGKNGNSRRSLLLVPLVLAAFSSARADVTVSNRARTKFRISFTAPPLSKSIVRAEGNSDSFAR